MISKRDRRATIYPYIGSNDGGFVTSTYDTARGTYWARLSPVPGSETMLDAQAGISARAFIEFADGVPVAEHDLIVIDGVQWKAGPITHRRAQRALILQVERSNEMPVLSNPDTALSGDIDGGDGDDVLVTSIDGGGADAVFSGSIDGGGA
jgi:hypothetical protein